MRLLLKEFRDSRQGSALVFTLLVFAVLMILATAAISVTSTDSQVAAAEEQSKAALYVAESAIDIAKQSIIDDIDAGRTLSGRPATNVPGGEYSYNLTDEGGNRYRISAVGYAKMPNGVTAAKTIDVIFKYISDPEDPLIDSTEEPDDPEDSDDTQPVTGVSLDRTALELAPEESDTLKATVYPSNADNKNVIWETADPGVATVTEKRGNNSKGIVKAVSNGTTDITVTTVDGGFTDTCNVIVTTTPSDDPSDPSARSGTTAFDYAILGQGRGTGMFQLTGDLEIEGPLHANSDIHFNNNGSHSGIKVSGPVSASGDIKIVGKNGDFSGVEMLAGEPSVTMPEINWNYIRENASKVFNHNTSLNGAADIHDGDVIFVEGDLNLTGEVSGNALIVATGNITISGNYDYPSSDYAVVGLIAGNNLKLLGDHDGFDLPGVDGPEITGFAIALNNVIVQGEADVNGSLISGNNMECGSGELEIEYYDGEDEDKTDNPVYKVFEIIGTEIIANYDEL